MYIYALVKIVGARGIRYMNARVQEDDLKWTTVPRLLHLPEVRKAYIRSWMFAFLAVLLSLLM